MQLELVEVKSKANKKEINKSANNQIYNYASSIIIISSLKSLKTCAYKLSRDKELIKVYDSNR